MRCAGNLRTLVPATRGPWCRQLAALGAGNTRPLVQATRGPRCRQHAALGAGNTRPSVLATRGPWCREHAALGAGNTRPSVQATQGRRSVCENSQKNPGSAGPGISQMLCRPGATGRGSRARRSGSEDSQGSPASRPRERVGRPARSQPPAQPKACPAKGGARGGLATGQGPPGPWLRSLAAAAGERSAGRSPFPGPSRVSGGYPAARSPWPGALAASLSAASETWRDVIGPRPGRDRSLAGRKAGQGRRPWARRRRHHGPRVRQVAQHLAGISSHRAHSLPAVPDRAAARGAQGPSLIASLICLIASLIASLKRTQSRPRRSRTVFNPGVRERFPAPVHFSRVPQTNQNMQPALKDRL